MTRARRRGGGRGGGGGGDGYDARDSGLRGRTRQRQGPLGKARTDGEDKDEGEGEGGAAGAGGRPTVLPGTCTPPAADKHTTHHAPSPRAVFIFGPLHAPVPCWCWTPCPRRAPGSWDRALWLPAHATASLSLLGRCAGIWASLLPMRTRDARRDVIPRSVRRRRTRRRRRRRLGRTSRPATHSSHLTARNSANARPTTRRHGCETRCVHSKTTIHHSPPPPSPTLTN